MVKNPSIRVGMVAPIVYGTLLLISGATAIYLPETNNAALPVNLKDATSNNNSSR